MKVLIILLVVIALASTGWCMSVEQRKKFLLAHGQCLVTSKVTDNMVTDALLGKFSDDPRFKEHIFCFAKKMSYIDDKGDFNKDAIAKDLKEHFKDDAALQDVLKKCLVKGDTALNSAFNASKCAIQIVMKN